MKIAEYFENIKNMPVWHLPIFIILAVVSYMITKKYPKIGLIVTPIIYYGTAFGLLYHDLYSKRKQANKSIVNDDFKTIAIKCVPFAVIALIYSIVFLLVPLMEKTIVTRIVAQLEKSPLGLIVPVVYCIISLVALEASQV